MSSPFSDCHAASASARSARRLGAGAAGQPQAAVFHGRPEPDGMGHVEVEVLELAARDERVPPVEDARRRRRGSRRAARRRRRREPRRRRSAGSVPSRARRAGTSRAPCVTPARTPCSASPPEGIGEDALKVLQTGHIYGTGQPFLAGEVVVDAADARRRRARHVGDRGADQAALVEGSERAVEDVRSQRRPNNIRSVTPTSDAQVRRSPAGTTRAAARGGGLAAWS